MEILLYSKHVTIIILLGLCSPVKLRNKNKSIDLELVLTGIQVVYHFERIKPTTRKKFQVFFREASLSSRIQRRGNIIRRLRIKTINFLSQFKLLLR